LQSNKNIGILKILHVDDEEDFLTLTRSYLKKIDSRFNIESVSSPEDVIPLVEKNKYDIIISDYQMPGKSGLKLLEELRKKGYDIPFVVFTGRGQESTVIQAFKMGADHYLPKSGNSKTLFRDLRQIIVQISDRYRTSKIIQESEEKYKLLMENASDGIFITDADMGIILEANEQASKMTGKSVEELINLNLVDIYPLEEKEKHNQIIDMIKKERSIYLCCSQISHKEGYLLPVKINVNLARVGDREILQWIFRDKSDSQRLDDSLKKHKEEISHCLENISHDLHNLRKKIPGTQEDSNTLLQNSLEKVNRASSLLNNLFTS
jgi:PAS domain S-box-containing protein